MSRRLFVRPLAARDLREAQDWYDEQRPGLGDEFRAAIDLQLARVLERPHLYPVIYRDVRRAIVRRFPYLLYFGLSGDDVVVLACLHSSRKPAGLRYRLG